MIKKRITIKDFYLDNQAKETGVCYNYNLGKGLKNAWGVVECLPPILSKKRAYNTPTNVTKILGLSYFSQYSHVNQKSTYRLLMYGDDTKLYINQMFANSYNFTPNYNLTFTSNPVCLCYRYADTERAVIAGADKMVVWNSSSTPYELENAPIVNSMCVCGNILFCSLLKDCYKIWYNKNLDFEKITGEDANSGYILMDVDLGLARKVISMDDSVYIFRDYGISKINIYKDELVLSEVYKSNTLINQNTICVCGNNVVFLTSNGIYIFNGTNVSKCNIDISNLNPDLKFANSTSLGENYFLTLKLDFADNKQVLCETGEYVNNALLIYNVNDNSYQIIRGVDILSLLALKTEKWETVLTIFNSGDTRKIGELVKRNCFFSENLPKFWCKTNIFEDSNLKVVTKLKIDCEEGTNIELDFGKSKLNFVALKTGVNTFYFKQHCNNLKLSLSSNNLSSSVNNIEVEYYDC